MNQFDTPILLIVFNRPKETKQVLDVLRQVRPAKVFVAQDAPREGNQRDQSTVLEVQNLIEKEIDWPCKVEKLFQEKNLGCGFGPATAITWFFKNVEQGIILEDDCVPDQSFFRFCEELLNKYKDNKKIMHISGDNYQDGIRRGPFSYYFSKYTHNWGWATWAHAWKYFDHSLISESERNHVWDAAWEKSVRKESGYGIIPQVNLVQNIGFSSDATHTKNTPTKTYFKTSIVFPLSHPLRIHWEIRADYYTFKHYFHHNIPALIVYRLKKLFR